MAAVLAVLLAALAAALALGPAPGVSRLQRLAVSGARGRHEPVLAADARPPNPHVLASDRAKATSALLAGVAACWLVGGFAGAALGIGVGLLSWRALRNVDSAALSREKSAYTQAFPLVAGLVSAAVAAGSPPVVAAEVVADAVGGSIGSALRSMVASVRLGTDPVSGSLALAAEPVLRPLARALIGSMSRGTSPISMLDRLARDARDTARWAAEARARSLGARAAAPLGLCFLPAFVLVGIVPVVASAGLLLP